MSEPVRVALWTPCWSQVGGTETFHRHLLRALDASPAIDLVGVGVLRTPHDSIFDAVPPVVPVEFGPGALERAARDAQVVIQWGLDRPACKLPAQADESNRPRLVTVVHGSPRSDWTREIAHAVAPVTSLYVAVSRRARECVEPGRPVVVIPNPQPAIPFTPLRPRDLHHAQATCLFAGRLVSDKGIDAILRAARLLDERLGPNRRITWEFVGAGPWDRKLRQLANFQTTGTGPRIVLHDPRPDWWTIPHDLLLNPARHEGFGFSVTEAVMDEALDWLKQRSDEEPYFLNIWFHAPHEPVATPEEFRAPYRRFDEESEPNRSVYYGSVALIDHEVGRLLDAIDARGDAARTLVVFTSDNGPETLRRYRGAVNSYGSPGPLRGRKLHIYEAGHRVPALIRWPQRIVPGGVLDEPVGLIDLLPTMAELIDIPLPEGVEFDGTSLVPLLQGQPLRRDVPLVFEYERALSRPFTGAVIDGPWKLLADTRAERFELYRIDRDQGEQINILEQKESQDKEVVLVFERLKQTLAERRRAFEPPESR